MELGAGVMSRAPQLRPQVGAGEMMCPLTMWGLHLPVDPTPAGQGPWGPLGPGEVTLTMAFSGRFPWTGQANKGEAQRWRTGWVCSIHAAGGSAP